MENNKGTGIFYGVIGVATLVVTIIGATFAFFSAQTNSANNAVRTQSSQVTNLQLAEVKDGIKTNLIPVETENTNFPTMVAATTGGCKDSNQNEICSVYQFTVTNPNATAQQIYFYMEPSVNTFTNLHYAVFKGYPSTFTDVNATATTPGTGKDAYSVADNSLVIKSTQLTLNSTDRFELEALRQVLPASQSVKYTIVLWIEETQQDQTTSDSGKAFAAGIRIATGQVNAQGQVTGGGVTGVVSAS